MDQPQHFQVFQLQQGEEIRILINQQLKPQNAVQILKDVTNLSFLAMRICGLDHLN